jgi:hypothetical protein
VKTTEKFIPMLEKAIEDMKKKADTASTCQNAAISSAIQIMQKLNWA